MESLFNAYLRMLSVQRKTSNVFLKCELGLKSPGRQVTFVQSAKQLIRQKAA